MSRDPVKEMFLKLGCHEVEVVIDIDHHNKVGLYSMNEADEAELNLAAIDLLFGNIERGQQRMLSLGNRMAREGRAVIMRLNDDGVGTLVQSGDTN